ncbi:class I SAM-dependent methyltransferase [Prochlorococcus sp. MIT 1307]|uniref:class I SAM-dependent methyltransferase n=1 Tax=Prochlorococcus sp. MIT 1307 TaxID=3096219 RepID=UPI002A75E9BE|nr:class I SAM-dependent methyltransferase [Prochlorococcus sp. MIT 1307]
MSIDFEGKSFLELGAGRSLILPLSLYIQGAREVVSVDLNPYFSIDIWNDSLKSIVENIDIIKKDFPKLDSHRLDLVLSTKNLDNVAQILGFLNSIGIRYIAPCDSTRLPFRDKYFDFQISTNVLEHIPKNKISGIFPEIKRVLSEDGLCLNLIDYSDHFAHSDHNISLIHFLRFSSQDFKSLAGNRYMYMNRLRDDDFQQLFADLEMKTIFSEKVVDSSILNLLKTNDKSVFLHDDFKFKEKDCLATTHAWYGLSFS